MSRQPLRDRRIPLPGGRRAVRVLLAVLVGAAVPPAPAAAAGEEPHPTGALIGDLEARRSPEHRYALYLPPAWSAEGSWPLLVVLDPRGRAEEAARIFLPGAERYGWVILSSYDSRSDLADGRDPNGPVLEALLNEAGRYAVDLGRVYLTGFSGTSKFAWVAGQRLGGVVAGIIGCGGALPPGPWADFREVDFAYFGVAGIDDFNHRTMRELDDLLDETGAAHRFEYFPGRHQWPGSDLATQALGWMELQAMKEGSRKRDLVIVESLWDRWLTEARDREAAGDLHGAWRLFASLARDFLELRPVTAASAAAERLAARPEVLDAEAELRAALAEEGRYRDEVGKVIRHILYQQAPRELTPLLAELRIAELRAAADGDSFAAQAARRQLELAFVQTAFYTPRILFASKAPRRAALSLGIAAAIRPEAAGIWVELARAQALAGEPRLALESLETAVDRGFSDLDRLRTDRGLEAIRDRRAFRKLIERLEGAG